jgi:hypothetical protein
MSKEEVDAKVGGYLLIYEGSLQFYTYTKIDAHLCRI